MNSRKLNIRTENWSEEPFSISRSYEDNFDVVVVEIEQNGFKGWGEGSQPNTITSLFNKPKH